MLKKKIGKIVTASAVSACMVVNATAAMLPSFSLTAFAGEEVGNNTFDGGVGLPWHICESGPGKLKFDIDNGSYNVTIVEKGGAAMGGESRWDCQFRHRGLVMESGHEYTVKAEVTASNSGQIYTKIGDSGSPYREVWHNGYGGAELGQGWNCMNVTANQTLKIDSTFTCTENIEVGEWAWQFGGAGEHQSTDCFPNGTLLKFDNLYLTDNTDNVTDWYVRHPVDEIQENNVHVNQIGYYTGLSKKATLHFDDEASYKSAAQTFEILDASGKSVYTGTSTPMGYDNDSGMYVHVLDFTDFKTEGTGYTISCDGGTSYAFDISNKIYDGVLTNAVNYYYQNRSGIEIQSQYITSAGEGQTASDLAHKSGHNPDTAYIQTAWIKSYKADGSDVHKSAGSLDGTGGWYDAGDHGKYVVNGGISVWTLQNMYERTLNDDNNSSATKFDDKGSIVVIPEANNGIPDILDETRVELEWFFKMIVDSDYSMTYDLDYGKDTKKYENMVYHKLHDHKWTGLAVLPYGYEEDWGTIRIVKPPSTAATLNLVACAAQAARLYEDIDSAFAAECLANAKKCYEAAKLNPELYAVLDQAIGGGAYGDNEVRDDFYWAACELYATTGDATYLSDLSAYSGAFVLPSDLSGGENNGSFGSFNWGCTAGLGTISLYLNPDGLSADQVAKVEDSITAAADKYVAKENEQGFGIPYQGATFTDAINIGVDENGNLIEIDGYEWGSNSFVINNAIVMAYAYDITDDTKYIDGVSTALDYIFGRNALDFSYVTGYGDYHCENPHHRFWSYELDPTFPLAPAGVLSGGANSGMQDPYIRGAGYKMGNVPPQLCYIDSVESWSTNEVTINWNAPFAWVMSFMEDEAPLADSEGNTGEETETLYGDVNCDGTVNVADLVLLSRFVSQDSTLTAGTVSAQGKINGNVNLADDGINADDITGISMYLASMSSLPIR